MSMKISQKQLKRIISEEIGKQFRQSSGGATRKLERIPLIPIGKIQPWPRGGQLKKYIYWMNLAIQNNYEPKDYTPSSKQAVIKSYDETKHHDEYDRHLKKLVGMSKYMGDLEKYMNRLQNITLLTNTNILHEQHKYFKIYRSDLRLMAPTMEILGRRCDNARMCKLFKEWKTLADFAFNVPKITLTFKVTQEMKKKIKASGVDELLIF